MVALIASQDLIHIIHAIHGIKNFPKVKFLIFSNSSFGSYDSLYIFFYDYPQSYHQSFEYHAETQSAQRCFLPTYCFAHAETRHNGARPQRPADSYA